jgi:hypothetical protein
VTEDSKRMYQMVHGSAALTNPAAESVDRVNGA